MLSENQNLKDHGMVKLNKKNDPILCLTKKRIRRSKTKAENEPIQ